MSTLATLNWWYDICTKTTISLNTNVQRQSLRNPPTPYCIKHYWAQVVRTPEETRVSTPPTPLRHLGIFIVAFPTNLIHIYHRHISIAQAKAIRLLATKINWASASVHTSLSCVYECVCGAGKKRVPPLWRQHYWLLTRNVLRPSLGMPRFRRSSSQSFEPLPRSAAGGGWGWSFFLFCSGKFRISCEYHL